MLRFVSNIVPLLEINKQTMTRIGLLSDTHSYWDDKYLKYFEECDEIWHAGDIGSVEVAERLAAFRPFRAVYGNIDGQETLSTDKPFYRRRCRSTDEAHRRLSGQLRPVHPRQPVCKAAQIIHQRAFSHPESEI